MPIPQPASEGTRMYQKMVCKTETWSNKLSESRKSGCSCETKERKERKWQVLNDDRKSNKTGSKLKLKLTQMLFSTPVASGEPLPAFLLFGDRWSNQQKYILCLPQRTPCHWTRGYKNGPKRPVPSDTPSDAQSPPAAYTMSVQWLC